VCTSFELCTVAIVTVTIKQDATADVAIMLGAGVFGRRLGRCVANVAAYIACAQPPSLPSCYRWPLSSPSRR
jgi:hypothetical protein